MRSLLKWWMDKPVIALDIGTSSIKMVQLRRRKSDYELLNFGLMPLPPNTITADRIVEPETVIQAIRNLISSERVKTKQVALAVSGPSVVIKKIMLPLMSEEELATSIYGEVEQYIPYNVEEVNLDYFVLPYDDQETDQMQVIFVAVKSEKIQEYTDIILEAGLNPAVIDVDVFAIENSYEFNYGIPTGTIGLVDIGANITNINILEEGYTSFTRDLPFGGENFNRALEQELGVTPEEAEGLKLGLELRGIPADKVSAILINVVQDLIFLINESLEFFYSSTTAKEVNRLVLSGGCAKLPGLDQLLSTSLNCTVEISNPFKNIRIDHKVFDPEYIETLSPMAAVGIGLALRSPVDKF